MEQYQLSIRNLMTDNGEVYTTYGIKATNGDSIRFYDDISICKTSVEKLIQKFNTHKLSVEHIDDAIENFLYDLTVE